MKGPLVKSPHTISHRSKSPQFVGILLTTKLPISPQINIFPHIDKYTFTERYTKKGTEEHIDRQIYILKNGQMNT